MYIKKYNYDIDFKNHIYKLSAIIKESSDNQTMTKRISIFTNLFSTALN